MKKFSTWFLLSLMMACVSAQPWLQAPYLEMKSRSDSTRLSNFYEIQQAFERYEAEQATTGNDFDEDDVAENSQVKVEDEGKFPGYMQFKRWENYMQPRVYPSGEISLPATKQQEFEAYLHSPLYRTSGTSATNFAGNWTPLGPTGTQETNGGDFTGAARVNFLHFDPTNSNIMWTSAPLGGLWKSTDGGQNWATNTDLLPIIGCSDIAIHPLNPQIMYLATGDANGTTAQLTMPSIGVLKSTDGGLTWGGNTMNWALNLNRGIYKLLINPVNPNMVFAATSNGIYRTSNAGGIWNFIQGGNFTDIEFMPGNPNIVYASSGVYLAGGTFYKSINGGTSFVSIAAGLPLTTDVARLEIGVTPADPNYVYIVAIHKNTYSFNGLYRSTDAGTTFSLRSNSPNILAAASGASQAWYNLCMAVSPLHKDTLLVGATNLYRSTDGGLTWAKHSSETGGFIPYIHPDHHAITFLPNTDSVYFSGNDGGIYKTADRGLTWTPLNGGINGGMQISMMYKLATSHLNPYKILTGHQDMGTHQLNGNTWGIFTFNTGDGMECLYEYNNDSIRYISSYQGRILKTINNIPLYNVICNKGGAGVNATSNWVTPIIMHPQYDSILLVGKAQVWRSITSGTGFVQVGNVTGGAGNIIQLAYAPSNPNYIYVAKSNRVFVSTNGNNFSDKTGTLPIASASITDITVSNTNSNKVWVTFSGYSAANKVWFSADAGLTWSNYSTGLPNLPVNCIVYQNGSNDALFIGTDIGIYFIDNANATWQPFFDGLPNVDVQELEIAYNIGKIRAATNGRGLWESDLVAAPFAVEFIEPFSATPVNHGIEVMWTTASEQDAHYFEVQRSIDGIDFYLLKTTEARGNSSVLHTYKILDNKAINGTNYYKIKEVGYNGETHYSKIVSAKYEGLEIDIYPNPLGNMLYLTSNFSLQKIEIINPLGKVVKTVENPLQEIDISDLAASVYYVKCIDKNGGYVLKNIIKE